MRQTIYFPSHGYVTVDKDFEYVGNGIFGDAFNLVKDLVTSKAVRDIAVDAGKSFASTAGKKAGEKAAEKIVDKVFSKKTKTAPEEKPKVIPKKEQKKSKDLLSQIYGNGLFRQSGKGLRRV